MRRLALLASLAVLIAVGGCERSRPDGSALSPSGPPASPSKGREIVLPRLVLRADLSEKPAAWDRVLYVPFGKAREHLGFVPSRESPTFEPSSFAFARDGSVWVLDPAKERVAHYSPEGRYLGEIEGVNRFARDIAFTRNGMHILQSPSGIVSSVQPDGSLGDTEVNDGRRRLMVADLIASEIGLLGQVAGYTSDPENGPHGIARLAIPGSGHARLMPGVPVGVGRWVTIEAIGDQDFEVRYVGEDEVSVQPIRVDFFVRAGSKTRSIPAVVGPGNLVPLGDDVAMYVMIAGARERAGGRWLLRVGTGHSPLLWERLEDPVAEDDAQVRHLAAGPDDDLYLMVTRRRGVAILRRSTSPAA